MCPFGGRASYLILRKMVELALLTAPAIRVRLNWVRRKARRLKMAGLQIGEVLLAASMGAVLRKFRIAVGQGDDYHAHQKAPSR